MDGGLAAYSRRHRLRRAREWIEDRKMGRGEQAPLCGRSPVLHLNHVSIFWSCRRRHYTSNNFLLRRQGREIDFPTTCQLHTGAH